MFFSCEIPNKATVMQVKPALNEELSFLKKQIQQIIR